MAEIVHSVYCVWLWQVLEVSVKLRLNSWPFIDEAEWRTAGAEAQMREGLEACPESTRWEVEQG